MREAHGLKAGVLLAYGSVILMNILANAWPLFGRSTGAISNQFDALFTPAGFTFSIWGLIYLLLGLFVARLMTYDASTDPMLFRKLAIWFIISCLFNIAWLIVWHALLIVWAMAMLSFLSYTVGRIAVLIHELAEPPAKFERTTFMIYFGWVSVASIANVTIWLVSLDLIDPFGTASIWLTSLLVLIGVGIAINVIRYFKSPVYSLVYIWAYLGIVLNQFERPSSVPWLLVGTLIFSILTMIAYNLIAFLPKYSNA